MFSSLCLAFSLIFWGPHSAKDHTLVEFVRVWPQWRDAAEFKRISEYYTGVENESGLQIRRSQPSKRSGYYFLARVRHPTVSLAEAKFQLHIITPDAPDPRPVLEFPAGTGPGEDVFQIGLTGKDWPNSKVHPVAWRLDLVAKDGHLLAWSQSFLWEKPGIGQSR
jgi:hypothetical protein